MLGFTREMLMAAALGTGPIADAFYAAFQFPNMFRRLFAEGAFNAAFVPLFAKEIEANGMDGARRFAEEVFGVLFSALIVLTILMQLSMPLLVSTIIAPGFADDPEKFDLTVNLAWIMFPYLMCMSLGAMMAGMLNSLRRYFAAAIAPVFLNIILIGVLAYAWWQGHDGREVGYGLAWGVLASGLVQLAIVWAAVRHAGIRIGFKRPRMTPNVKRLLWLAFPAAITGGITQINTLVGTAIASTQASAVASLAMADRVYQLAARRRRHRGRDRAPAGARPRAEGGQRRGGGEPAEPLGRVHPVPDAAGGGRALRHRRADHPRPLRARRSSPR